MKVEKFVIGMIQTNCYLVQNEESKECFLVDPAICPEELVSHIKSEGLELKAILLTHGHFDHIMGIDGFVDEFHVPVYVYEEDADAMTDPKLNQSSVYTGGYTYEGARSIREGQILKLAGYDFEVFHTPGHTKGGCCYYVRSEDVLFSGDTLFQNSIGRTDFPGGSMSDLVRAVKEKLMVLPDETLVYPGHMGETTIGHEKTHNPFL